VRTATAAVAAALAGAMWAGQASAAVGGSWVGTFVLPGSATAVAIAVDVHGRRATVSLGPGHASATEVPVAIRGARLRFSVPGLPANVVFSGSLRGSRIGGSVTQGKLRGSFRLRRGRSALLSALGLYRSESGAAVAVIKAEGLPAWLVELPSGRTHGLNATLTTVGGLLGETSGDGTLAVGPGGLVWTHDGVAVSYTRARVLQKEVRVGSLAGTLTVPEGPGPFPAAALVHGSSAAGREEFQAFAAYLESIGVAVLATDKRGVGQSGGTFPGDQATDSTLRALASDAQAQVRFLGRLPQIDAARTGLLGDSQAGWVMALAAAGEPGVRWAVALAGPTTTVGETDLFTQLAGAEQTAPAGTRAQMLAQVRAFGPSGFDPLPSLRSLSIPFLWVLGDDDRNVPTELCVERLESIQAGHDYTSVVLHMTHALLDLPSGLYSSLPRSPGFTPTLFPTVGDWLRRHGLASSP
jgi:pimeloyl-ACP methyl ester carboxylesterase